MRSLFSRVALGVVVAAVLLPTTIAPRPASARGTWWHPRRAAFYVAADGNDAWSGRRPRPNRSGTDGPFATIQRAQQAVRDLPAEEKWEPVKILIRDGVYRISEPLVFTPADSGTKGASVIYAAYPGEHPVISGGRVITGWEQAPDGTWKAPVPRLDPETPWRFSQLFVDGQRRQRCRHPNEGYLRTAGPIKPLDRQQARRDVTTKMGFRYSGDDLDEWPDWQQMNIALFHSWTASIHWASQIDTVQKIVTFTAPSGWPVGYWEKNQRFYIESVRRAFDEPGEWYLDEREETLYYRPLPGESIGTFRPVAPVARQLLRLEGDPTGGEFVQYLRFEGLSFQHAAWDLPRDKAHDGQAAILLTAAIETTWTRQCVFRDLELAHVGTYGFWFASGSQENLLTGSELHDLGAGGVKMGTTSGKSDAATASRANTVDNCFIHDGGRIARAGVGVWIGRSSFNRVSHNEICDFDYSAVSVGWSWGYAASSANHNVIEYNRLHHIGNGVLSDMGGVYTLGVSPGTVVRGNILHDIYSYGYGGWGLYTDEGSSYIVMERNLVYDTKSGGFHQHYGKENAIRNNILAFSREGQLIRSRGEDHTSFSIEGNIIVFDNGRPLGGNWTKGSFVIDGNIYWDTRGAEDFRFAGLSFEAWRERGNDRNSVIVDPLFRDADARDFRLQPSSPVPLMMIEPLQAFDQVGLYGPASWRNKPAAVTHRSIDPEARPPR